MRACMLACTQVVQQTMFQTMQTRKETLQSWDHKIIAQQDQIKSKEADYHDIEGQNPQVQPASNLRICCTEFHHLSGVMRKLR